MNNRKFISVLRYSALYFLIITLFAVVYFFLFQKNTTNFYISEEFNENCESWFIERSYDALIEIQDRKETPFSIDDFRQLIKPINDRIRQAYDSIDSLQVYCSQLGDKSHFYHNLLEASREYEIEQFRATHLSALDEAVLTLEQCIQDSLILGVTEEQIIINGTYLRLANMKLICAKEKMKVSSYILDNFGSFGDRNILDSLNASDQAILDVRSEISRLEECRRVDFNLYEDAIRSFHRNRLESVNFMDFVYFSLLIISVR